MGAESGLLTADRLQPLNCDFSPLVEGWNDWGLKLCRCSGQNPGCAVCPSSWSDINRLLQGGPIQTEYSAPESIRELVGLFSMSSRGTRDPKAVVTLIPLCSVGGQGREEGCRVFWGPPQPPGNFHCSHGWGSLYTAPPIRGQELRASGESVSLGWGELASLCSRGCDILAAT